MKTRVRFGDATVVDHVPMRSELSNEERKDLYYRVSCSLLQFTSFYVNDFSS